MPVGETIERVEKVKTMRWLRRINVLVRDESGVALALTLAMTILIVIVSAALVATAMNEYQTSGVAETSRQAFQLATAGVEKGIFELKRDGDWSDNVGATQEHALGNTTTWYRLYNGAAYVENADFPASQPLGRITVQLRGASSSY